MMTATQARTLTNNALAAQAQAIAASKAREQAEIDSRRNARTTALDRRIDALVDRFLTETVFPAIEAATENGASALRFNTACHTRNWKDRPVDTLVKNSVFGRLSWHAQQARNDKYSVWALIAANGNLDTNERVRNSSLIRRVFDQSHLNSHGVDWWCGNRVETADCTLEFHILHRTGTRLKEAGFSVTLPSVETREGCAVNQDFRDLIIRW
mgnify:CR=1 FL=1